MTRRIDTIRNIDAELQENLKDVPKNDPRKYRYGKNQTVDGLVTLKENKEGDLTGLIQAHKSRAAAAEKGEAYGGMTYERKYLKGPAIANIISSMRDPKDAVTAEDLHQQIKDSDNHEISFREAFETTTYQSKDPNHKGQAAISLKKDDVVPATLDFREEDKFAQAAKERQAREAEEAKEAREAKSAEAAEKPAAKDEDDLELPY